MLHRIFVTALFALPVLPYQEVGVTYAGDHWAVDRDWGTPIEITTDAGAPCYANIRPSDVPAFAAAITAAASPTTAVSGYGHEVRMTHYGNGLTRQVSFMNTSPATEACAITLDMTLGEDVAVANAILAAQ